MSRATRRRIRWNIAVGMGFNAFAVLAGGAGVFDPIVGALVHNLGSVLVVISSASLAFTPVPCPEGTPAGLIHGPGATASQPAR